MKKFIFLLILFCFKTTVAQINQNIEIKPNSKIGLSLAGGGAKGFAHIGTLKVLDSLGVKIDYIAGTSMGAIIGGLYASGYTGKEIEKIVLETDFYSILSNEKQREESSFFNKSTDKYFIDIPIQNHKIIFPPKSYSKGQKNISLLKDLFQGTDHIEDFSKLPIPFLCIGTNLESGKIKIFEKGNLTSSIMASSAYPSLIDPIKINDSIYVDGAMTVNYPSKQLKDKGMNIVIGVDLNQGLKKKENLESALSILDQIISFNIQKNTKEQYKYTDINIHPDLEKYNALSYDNKKEILELGYKEALKYVDILKQLPKREKQELKVSHNSIYASIFKIDSLVVNHSKIFNQAYIERKIGIKLPSFQTHGSINKMIDKLYATNNYHLISYDILRTNDKNILALNVEENQNQYFLKLGFHYDKIFQTGFLINTTAKRLLFKNEAISMDVIIGDQPRYYFNYFLDNGFIPGFGINSTGMKLSPRNDENEIKETWKWFKNNIFLQSIWKDKYAIGGGISLDHFSINNTGQSTHFFNPYVFIKSDTRNDTEFPTKGIYIDAEGKIIDLLNENLEKKYIQAKAKLYINIPFSSIFTYQINLLGGFTFGKNIPYFYKYRLGGIFEQNLNNFISFGGFPFGNIETNNYIIASNNLQFNFNKNYFLIGSVNFANIFENNQTNKILNVNENSIGFTAGYKTIFGQIKISYYHPIHHENGLFNVIFGHWF